MGKLGSSIRFAGPVVLKDRRGERPTEAAAMRDWRVFAPSVIVGGTRVLLRGSQAVPDDLPEAAAMLRERMWVRPPGACAMSSVWKGALANHLRRVYPCERLVSRALELPFDFPAATHGDATAANLVRFPAAGLRWIDPLHRDYIPSDRTVDVGKMAQSCWGYERVLAGGEPELDRALLHEVMRAAGLSVSVYGSAVITWSMIHIARLLRYHDLGTAAKFGAVLRYHGFARDTLDGAPL